MCTDRNRFGSFQDKLLSKEIRVSRKCLVGSDVLERKEFE